MSTDPRTPYLPLVATFGDPEMAEAWSEAALIEAWCRVEGALAAAQAELGDIPVVDAVEIRRRIGEARIDADRKSTRLNSSHT